MTLSICSSGESFGNRLLLENVQPGENVRPGAEELDQFLLPHDLAAGGVDENGVGLEPVEEGATDQPGGLLRQAALDSDDVGLLEKLLERPAARDPFGQLR